MCAYYIKSFIIKKYLDMSKSCIVLYVVDQAFVEGVATLVDGS